MKTYILIVSRYFPKTHPEAGAPTFFVENIINRVKSTTIRGNNEYWRNIVREVNNGDAIVSLRYWSNKPYKSKQIEFAQCTKLFTKRVFITNDHNGFEMSVDGKYADAMDIVQIVDREGLSAKHFLNWFSEKEFSGIMLGFLELEKV